MRSEFQGLGCLLNEVLPGELMESDWRRTSARYRMALYDHGEICEGDTFTGKGAKRGFNRASGARKIKGADWGELRVLHDLQVDVIHRG